MFSWFVFLFLGFQIDLNRAEDQTVKIIFRSKQFWCSLPCPRDTKHTMCETLEADSTSYCWDTVYQMNLEKREAILDWHNDLRDFVAGGGLGWKASNMRALSWDFELEQVARRWAFQCRRAKDECRTNEHYSHSNISQQNVGWVTTALEKELPPTKTILENWNTTKNVFYEENSKDYHDYLEIMDLGGADHPFIQMSKACLEKIGCGEVVYVQGQAHRRFLACNYAPSQCKQHDLYDEFDHKLFKVGTPCSECPQGTDCHFFDSGHKHLCQQHHGSGKRPILKNPKLDGRSETTSTNYRAIGAIEAIISCNIVNHYASRN